MAGGLRLPAFLLWSLVLLHCGKYRLALDRPLVMGIVNLTPDSFSGDGVGASVALAVGHARAQLDAGADILDLGAESTRPGAPTVSAAEELARLLPVLREVVTWGVPISVDTYKPEVMRIALEEGCSMINDISGLRDPRALATVAASDCGVCVMHMQGLPGNMQDAPSYAEVVEEVNAELQIMVARCRQAGIADARLVLDPGFGFGKTVAHNFSLFRGLTVTTALGFPVLAGVSRKSMLGAITGREAAGRMPASIVAAVLAAQRGAAILRVHDVAETCDALKVWRAVEEVGKNND